MTRIPDLLADALAADVEARTAWDEPPALFNVYLDNGGISLRDVGLPAAFWARGRAAEVLSALSRQTERMRDLFRRGTPPGLYAVAFRCEHYRVEAAPGHEREVGEMARRHALDTHPDRVEERCLWAVDRAGITYLATKERVSGQTHRFVTYPHPTATFGGLIPEALDRILTVYLDVVLPARPARFTGPAGIAGQVHGA